jgi:hypothetical protein
MLKPARLSQGMPPDHKRAGALTRFEFGPDFCRTAGEVVALSAHWREVPVSLDRAKRDD